MLISSHLIWVAVGFIGLGLAYAKQHDSNKLSMFEASLTTAANLTVTVVSAGCLVWGTFQTVVHIFELMAGR